MWASNEPGCSACSTCCSGKYSFGYFSYQTFLTLIKLSLRYCKVPVKMVSKCGIVAWKWWVIKLLGKIFWQESVRRVDSILSIIFSCHLHRISCTQAQEGSCCPQPQAGPAVSPCSHLGSSGHHPCLIWWGCRVTATHAHCTRGCPHHNSYGCGTVWLALCFGVVSYSWSAGAFASWGLSSQLLWRGPTGFHAVGPFWRHFKLALKKTAGIKLTTVMICSWVSNCFHVVSWSL